MTWSVGDVRAAVRRGIEDATDLRPRKGLFRAPLAEGIDLWLNIAVAVGNPRTEPHHANAFVGVRHEAVERLVTAATGQPLSITGTYFVPLYELVADARTYVSWPVRPESLDADVAELVRAVADFGIPWASRFDSLEAITAALPAWHRIDLAWYSLPAALTLLGRHEEADAAIERAIAAQAKSNIGLLTPLEGLGTRLREIATDFA